MTENNENVQASGLDSKFMKVAMTIVSVILMFGGAIYVPYLLSDIIHVDYAASNVVGIVLFIVGMGMLVFLIRKKVIE
jgi:flagellar basal body-associated protein FliL